LQAGKQYRSEEILQIKKMGEAHRHRYEFDLAFKKLFVKNGLKIVNRNSQTGLMEII
jgi:CTP synthase (UTP-ammonia lyase)